MQWKQCPKVAARHPGGRPRFSSELARRANVLQLLMKTSLLTLAFTRTDVAFGLLRD